MYTLSERSFAAAYRIEHNDFAPLLPSQEAMRQAILSAEQSAECDMGMRHAGLRYVSHTIPRREWRHG